MAQPIPAPTYTVFPAILKKGQTSKDPFFVTDDLVAAKLFAVQATAATNQQYIIFTSTFWTERFEDLPPEVIDALVFPFAVTP